MKKKPRRDKGFRRNPRTGILRTDGDLILEAAKALAKPRKILTPTDLAEYIRDRNFDVAASRKSEVGSLKSIRNGIYKIVDKWLVPQGKLVKVKVGREVSYFLPPFGFDQAYKIFGCRSFSINDDTYELWS